MILQMHAPEMAGNTEVTKAMQKQLIEVQKTDQAWGLTEGLMRHPVSQVHPAISLTACDTLPNDG